MSKPLNINELKGSIKKPDTILAKSDLNHAEKTQEKEPKEPSADELILNALIHGAMDITANNGLKYRTTRISNHIVNFRKAGLIIYTKRIHTLNKKWYGIYLLDTAEPNRAKAIAILSQMRKARKI